MWQTLLVYLVIALAIISIMRRGIIVWRSALHGRGTSVACHGCPGRNSAQKSSQSIQMKPLVQLLAEPSTDPGNSVERNGDQGDQ